jgi:hypothetical protein
VRNLIDSQLDREWGLFIQLIRQAGAAV